MTKTTDRSITIFDRRKFIQFFGLSSALLTSSYGLTNSFSGNAKEFLKRITKELSWKPITLAIPQISDGLIPDEQVDFYAQHETQDDLILPEGFTYNVIASWGDPVGDSRYGYNNDHIGVVETSNHQAFLVVNHETIDYDNFETYLETFPMVMGYSLPDEVFDSIEGDFIWNFPEMSETNPAKAMIKTIAMEASDDMGISVISVERKSNGDWVRTYSDQDRRISITQALKDPAKLSKSSGPARAIFIKENKIGFDDGLGDKCVGTYWNCSGTTTPWGTVISAEERLDSHVYEPVKADGSSFPPTTIPFHPKTANGLGSIFELAANKYGWAVEVNPANKSDFGTKHTMLGRYRHEAFAINCKENKPLAIFSGCDRKGGHIYKFISTDDVVDCKSKSNSKLLEKGVLHVAKFAADGTGYWIALTPDTDIDPILPSGVIGNTVSLPNPDRVEGGVKKYQKDEDVRADYQTLGSKLGDLYQGNDKTELQGAILIDAHYAANAVGATGCPRPEDCEFDEKKGAVYYALTAITDGSSDSPTKEIFARDDYKEKEANLADSQKDHYRPGMIIKIIDDENGDPESLTFQWTTLLMGGEPSDDKAGWVSPDNLEIDGKGNLWMVTDISTETLNVSVVDRAEVSRNAMRGIHGNNSAWFIPTSGEFVGQSLPFAMGPTESELCGLKFSADQKTLFLTPQHPGLLNGMRKNMAYEEREFTIKTTEGKEFTQSRKVPIGSNWPSKKPNQPPKPSIVAVRRKDNKPIT